MTQYSRRFGQLATLVLALLWSLSAAAADLGELKAEGVVGERADGYLGLVHSEVAVDANALITKINSKRKAEYQRIAVRNKIALSEVEALAGKKTLARTAPGGWIYLESWRQKGR